MGLARLGAGRSAPPEALGGAVTAVALANPFKHHLAPACPLHALTGLYCPFCGGTRATWAAAHLHFGLMLHENASVPGHRRGRIVGLVGVARAGRRGAGTCPPSVGEPST